MSSKKVLGIGNALVDILTPIKSDDLLQDFSLPKGSMQLVEDDTKANILQQTSSLPSEKASGGSAANTIHGLAKLKVDTSFIGKVGQDDLGQLYKNDMVEAGIHPLLKTSDVTSTGTAIAFVSEDSERTFATYLGAAIEVSSHDLTPDQFIGYDYFYIEGYLVQNHDLIETAVKMAKENGLQVVLDLASFNVVEGNLDFLQYIVKEYVNIIFANEEEAKSFTGKEPKEALNALAEIVDIAVVKIGSQGSLIKSGSQQYEVVTIKVNAVDTTGAGDQYAAGFLYGLINDQSLEVCGKIGALMAGTVIESIGGRIKPEVWDGLYPNIQKLMN
ncbi:MAG: adenosine kinase [Bacteroidetes bacterium]|jgi:sugar/nucleoside kinase (ribokinase family)|nr:adenosine kinase [Bacteroidota bacterium]